MSTTTRFTLVSTNARIDAIEATMDKGFAAILARLDGNTPTAPKAPKAAPRKAAPVREVRSASHTFLGERVGTGSRKLTKQNRKAFIAAHAWAKPGFSTAALRSEVAAGAKVNAGWNVAI